MTDDRVDDDRTDDDPQVAARSHLGPGETPVDPYEDVDVDSLPAWWREAIAEYEAHGLRPYQPSRFLDGEITYEIVSRLEADLDVALRFLNDDATRDDDWQVLVEGRRIGSVGYHRDPDGYGVYELTSDEFVEMVRRNRPPDD